MDEGWQRTGRGVVAPAEALTEADERELLSRIAARDRLAMRQFYLLYHRRLARFLTRITARRELVEEIVNDTLLIVWQRAAQFRGGSRISTWVMGIAWRHGLKSFRREKRAAAYPVAPETQAALEAQSFEDRDLLGQAMQGLSDEHRAAIDLAYVGGYSCEEIATIMGCPVNTVKTRLFYARRTLRAVLAEPVVPDVATERAPPVVERFKLSAHGGR
jgi:RNA polymerase sigma-70 factor (ECF subfamily)